MAEPPIPSQGAPVENAEVIEATRPEVEPGALKLRLRKVTAVVRSRPVIAGVAGLFGAAIALVVTQKQAIGENAAAYVNGMGDGYNSGYIDGFCDGLDEGSTDGSDSYDDPYD